MSVSPSQDEIKNDQLTVTNEKIPQKIEELTKIPEDEPKQLHSNKKLKEIHKLKELNTINEENNSRCGLTTDILGIPTSMSNSKHLSNDEDFMGDYFADQVTPLYYKNILQRILNKLFVF